MKTFKTNKTGHVVNHNLTTDLKSIETVPTLNNDYYAYNTACNDMRKDFIIVLIK